MLKEPYELLLDGLPFFAARHLELLLLFRIGIAFLALRLGCWLDVGLNFKSKISAFSEVIDVDSLVGPSLIVDQNCQK